MSLMRRLMKRNDPTTRTESATVRAILSQLEALDEPTARFIAAFAYVLARVAAADLEIDKEEEAAMERILLDLDTIEDQHVSLVLSIAREQARDHGGTEDYLATREFRNLSDRDDRIRLLRALLRVAAADGHVSEIESQEIVRIAGELDFNEDELKALRRDLRDSAS